MRIQLNDDVMEAFSALPVTGEFPSQRPVTRSFDVFFDLQLNKLLNKNLRRWCFRRHRAHYEVTAMSAEIHIKTYDNQTLRTRADELIHSAKFRSQFVISGFLCVCFYVSFSVVICM